MSGLKLVIGNKNYSSWSLRPWLLLTHAGIAFDEVRIGLFTATYRDEIARYSPAGKVPVLLDGPLTVWDSLAICEYVAEKFPDKALWPRERAARARARSVAAEMHSGFGTLRTHLPMNVRAHLPGRGHRRDVLAEAARIAESWLDCRTRFGAEGPFLFGAFSCADAMYAPVCSRFATYAVPLPDAARRYVDTILALPAMQTWSSAARAESEVLEEDEPYA